MCDAIQWFKDEGHNTESIAVLCAGNDIKFGEYHCKKVLSNIREHEVDIYDIIPDIEFEKIWVGKHWQLPNKEVHQEKQKEENVEDHDSNKEFHDQVRTIIKEQCEQKECPVCGGIEWCKIWGECVECMKPKDIKQCNKESEISDSRIDALLMKQFYAFQRNKHGVLNTPKTESFWKSQREGYINLTDEQ